MNRELIESTLVNLRIIRQTENLGVADDSHIETAIRTLEDLLNNW